jgi:protein-S-isoprenylcysteine O-methyltransferase Ste14
MWQLTGFAIATIFLAYVSRASLVDPRTHGFYRFFAWQGIVLQILLNLPFWFESPFALHHIAAWILLASSVLPLILGTRELRKHGRPSKLERQEPELYGFERTSRLVTSGVYRYIRHPMYSSLLLLDWGAYLKHPSLESTLLAAVVTAFLLATAYADESECARTFGPAYQAYRERTKMFIPHVL